MKWRVSRHRKASTLRVGTTAFTRMHGELATAAGVHRCLCALCALIDECTPTARKLGLCTRGPTVPPRAWAQAR